MADELTAEEKSAQEAEAVRVAEEAKAQEVKDDTVAYATYDKAMATAAKRKTENEALRKELAELQKAKLENDKNIDPTKYQEALEAQLADSQQKFSDLQTKFETTLEEIGKKEVDRTKLSAVWDAGRKAGMVDDRELLNFIDKEVVQIDEHGVVNQKSVETVINKLKTKLEVTKLWLSLLVLTVVHRR